MGWREQLDEAATPKGSIGLGLVVVLLSVMPSRFVGGADLSLGALANGAVFGLLAIALVQALSRLPAPRNAFVALGIASAALFWLLFGGQILGRDGGFAWFVAAALWAGISLAALAVLVIYRRT